MSPGHDHLYRPPTVCHLFTLMRSCFFTISNYTRRVSPPPLKTEKQKKSLSGFRSPPPYEFLDTPLCTRTSSGCVAPFDQRLYDEVYLQNFTLPLLFCTLIHHWLQNFADILKKILQTIGNNNSNRIVYKFQK